MIDQHILQSVLGITTSSTKQYQQLALSNIQTPNSLSFFDDPRYLDELNANQHITGVFVEENNAERINPEKEIFIVDDPRWHYFTLYNFIAKQNKVSFKSQIHPSSQIHPTSYIAESNVIIGKNCIIYPNVTILEDVELGDNCIIQSGTVLGGEGFEYKRTKKGILPVYHDGKLIVGNDVHFGLNNTIDKGYQYRHTIIGDDCKLDNQVHIAHCVQVGKRVLFPASCMLAGSITIGDDVWIGPNSSISSGVTIGNRAFITIGAVVTKNVEDDQRVTGNFAIPHLLFMKGLKKTMEGNE